MRTFFEREQGMKTSSTLFLLHALFLATTLSLAADLSASDNNATNSGKESMDTNAIHTIASLRDIYFAGGCF